MIDREHLLESTDSYLKSLIAEITRLSTAKWDSGTPFGELGIDSFHVLKIIKGLEAEFGSLPKTLLFEHFNIHDLSVYFADQHSDTLKQIIVGGVREESTSPPARQAAPAAAPTKVPSKPLPASGFREPVVDKHSAAESGEPILILEKNLDQHPRLASRIRQIYDRYKIEGSVSRGTRNIAPNLFIGRNGNGYFNYARSGDIILVYAYTGCETYFPTLAGQMYRYCQSQNFELNILAGHEITSVGDAAFSSTPFGALQRMENIRSFTLAGQKMRRLRYQVSRFRKAGQCRTEEYACGSDDKIAKEIAAIIDQWTDSKPMVNPLIAIVRQEILSGTLNPEHRIFLTYIDDVLQNVILITPMCSAQNGYLMDLEFYPKNMPLGGLEFAIINIVEVLAAEGCDMLSLGGTYGCKIASSPNADPRLDKILDDLREQNIFKDEGNLQFKNKFHPRNQCIFLCRPTVNTNPDNVIDIIMMIADPDKAQTSDEENHTPAHLVEGTDEAIVQRNPADAGPGAVERPRPDYPVHAADHSRMVIEGQDRSILLAEFGFNPLNVPEEHIEFDLKTDSWAQLSLPLIKEQTDNLYAQLPLAGDQDDSLRAIFPFKYFVLTASGRRAERLFYKAWQRKGIVLQNMLFPTTLFNQIDNDFTPLELPHPEAFRLDSPMLYKSNLDWEALAQQVKENPKSIALACIELSNNATGGHPLSIEHLGKVKALLSGESIPLVIDATRVLENARFVIENERAYAQASVWDVVSEILGYADAVVVSLAKDFGVDRGGLIATNDQALYERINSLLAAESGGLSVIDRKLIGLALQRRKQIAQQTEDRKLRVKEVWTALRQRGVPVVQPCGGHCILVDVKQIPEFSRLHSPVASFLAWLYLNTGIRAGAHSAGMQSDSSLNGLVRLAIPVGMSRTEVESVIARLAVAFDEKINIPDLTATEGNGAFAADIHARLQLQAYHRLVGQLLPKPEVDPESIHPGKTRGRESTEAAKLVPYPTKADAIAVVGMAGIYPKAKNLRQMWANLVAGKDCTNLISETRLAQRNVNDFPARYTGGFIDDVDQFDAGFFGVSPEEAAMLDPQERLFLQVAWETLEDAGYYPEALGGASQDIGVFVGAVWSMYQMLGVEEKMAGNFVNPNSFLWSIANRVSFWMNFSGPSLTLDTACSSSLTAVHFACEAIRRGECAGALVGGVNLDLHQSKFDINNAGGSLSPDGVCRAFGNEANGYVQGEGVGALFLKPLEQAIADGDNIHGIIKGSVVSHAGRASGYTAPNPQAQARVISAALEKAAVDANSIGYIEAHGTATNLGDAIEISGLTNAFSKFDIEKQTCPIGTVKTNIGHLEAASGVVGIQKILLQMKHRKLVPSLHSGQLNENIDFANSPFYVQQSVQEWPRKVVDGAELPYRAGISAFGAGGTNAHVIIEEYRRQPSPIDSDAENCERVFPLSAKTEQQLRESARRLRDFVVDVMLPEQTETTMGDVAYTLQVGRKPFDLRLAVIAKSPQALAEKLSTYLEGGADKRIVTGAVTNSEKVSGLLNRKEKQEFISLIARSGDAYRLASLWADGILADWRDLSALPVGRRVSLPTYPFADEHHWIARKQSDGRKVVENSETHPDRAVAETDLVANGSPAAAVNVHSDYYRFFKPNGKELPQGVLVLDAEEKVTLLVKQLFAERLGVSVDDIQPSMNIMETGIKSIDMAHMTQSLKQLIDPAFSPALFFECTTISSLFDVLLRQYTPALEKLGVAACGKTSDTISIERPEKIAGESVSSDEPLFIQDARTFVPCVSAEAVAHENAEQTKCLLLTGATGFLGIHILSEILHSDPDTRIYCLVRADDPAHGLQRIMAQAEKYRLRFNDAQMEILCGDITKPNLGLSEEQWNRCCNEVQQIIHASAHVNHIEGYATFRASTKGMGEIIRMAGSERLKLIQFVSSIAGCTLKSGDTFSIYEKEEFLEDGKSVYGGYGQSKWVQECFLKRANEHGIPYVIYRFGELCGSSTTGLGQTDDMLHRLLQMRLAIGCREKISSDVLDMLPVDFAAKLIFGTGYAPELWNRIVHATHLKPYSFANLYRKVQNKGLQFEVVTREEYLSNCYDFIRYLSTYSTTNSFVLECVLRDVESSMRNKKIMDGYFAILFPFDQENFKQCLHSLKLELPDWNTLMECYLSAWEQDECGFMSTIYDYQKWRLERDRKNGAALTDVPVAQNF